MIRERWRFTGEGKNRKLRRVDDDAPLRGKGAGMQVIRDIDPYLSPLGTGPVGSRRARREELRRHNCVEIDPSMHPSRFKGRPDESVDRLIDRIFKD